jgi:beta-mannosidase
VWQDCIFSCSIYPARSGQFVDDVRIEIDPERAPAAPSRVPGLWCGNNEMEWGWEMWGWAEPDLTKDAACGYIAKMAEREWRVDSATPLTLCSCCQTGSSCAMPMTRFFHITLPGWLATLTPIARTGPALLPPTPRSTNVNGKSQGDSHYWEVWHGRKPFTAYRKQFPRFHERVRLPVAAAVGDDRTYADEPTGT